MPPFVGAFFPGRERFLKIRRRSRYGGSQRVLVIVGSGRHGGAEAAPQLAANGGTPVRSKPLGGANWGPQYYDGKEQRQLEEVLESRNPFRFSNPLDKSKVALFKNEYAARMQTKYALAVTSGTC